MVFVCEVTATDLDSVTNSQLTYSVSDSSFSVQTLNNIGYIKTARYVLRLYASNDHSLSIGTEIGDFE